MENFSGIKELYDVSIRLNNPVEIGDKKYDINETILTLKTAEVAQVNEDKTNVAAKGGYNNPVLVNWEVDREMTFAISHGVLTPTSWALVSNSKMKEPEKKAVQLFEEVDCMEDENYCWVDLKYCPNQVERLGAQPNPDLEPMPMGRRPELLLKPLPPSRTKWIFCYDSETGQRIRDFDIYYNRIFFKQSYRKVLIDYTFDYEDKIKVIEVGNRLFKGFLRLSGKMSVKDQKTGRISTAILEMPKIKLSSSLAIKAGKSYEYSAVSDFFFTGYLDDTRPRGEQAVAYVTFLDKELSEEYI